MNKHTPGPWQKAEPFASVKAPGRPCIADCGSRSDLTAQANARLIAAAPDLLAALERTEEILLGGDPVETSEPWCQELVLNVIRPAIRKAKGD